MTTGFVIPAKELIDEIASKLESEKIIEVPGWTQFVKTSSAKQNQPLQENWYYLRAGSVMRKLYFKGSIGVQNLRKLYSHPKNRGVKPEKSTPSGGKILRTILQQLETAEMVVKDKDGRKLSPKGVSFIDKIASDLKPKIEAISQY